MSTARATSATGCHRQTGTIKSLYAAPSVDNPPSFPQLLVCLAFNQHSTSTTSWRFNKLSTKSKIKESDMWKASASNLHNQRQTTIITVVSSFVLCAAQWSDFISHEVVSIEQFEQLAKQLRVHGALKRVTLYCCLHQGKAGLSHCSPAYC